MHKKDIQKLLQNDYSRQNWRTILGAMFPEADWFTQDTNADITTQEQKDLAEYITQFGKVELNDDTLIFLEVKLKPDSVQLARNRVGLRKLISNEVIPGLTDAALVSYFEPDTKEWRFTFYSEKYGWDEDGKTIKKETHPKRYTYLAGQTEACKTAAERLEKLVENAGKNTLEQVLEAFSVQRISNEFFREYEAQYDKFVIFLTGKKWTKDGVKEEGKRITNFASVFTDSKDPEKEARDFVKKLLGRLVFLYFIQKKKWLGASSEEYNDGSPNFIYDLFHQLPDKSKYAFYSKWLTKLFFDALNKDGDHTFEMPNEATVYIPFLNGGLFERDRTDINTEKFGLQLPGELFSNPEDTETPNKRGFLDFLQSYNFTIYEDSPGDHTIAVDPEMLGHIFENLLEDNKDKGAYYTPKPIVHYMCQESLIEYLQTQLTQDTPSEEVRKLLENLIKKQDAGGLTDYTEAILLALRNVKVCDPAIGSGAFPMGILQEIYQAVEVLYHFSPDNVQEIWKLKDAGWNPAEVKRQIIQNSIYGVDIEKGAVDIARLRFWLSLIVDEKDPVALPNLDYKIVVGNSLVSKFEDEVLEINWNPKANVNEADEIVKKIEALLKEISTRQKDFFTVTPNNKKKLQEEIRDYKIELLINQLNLNRSVYINKTPEKGGMMPTARDRKHNLSRKLTIANFDNQIEKLKSLKVQPNLHLNYFNWELDFPEVLNPNLLKEEERGFDILIANPPFGVRVIGEERVYTKNKLGKVPDYEIYYLFIELLKLLGNKNAICTYIVPNSILFNVHAEEYRMNLLKKMSFLEILDLTDHSIFNATVRNIIFIAKFGASERVGFRKPSQADTINSLLEKEREFIEVEELQSFSHNWALAFRLSEKTVKVIKTIKTGKIKIEDRFEDISQGLIAYDMRRGQSKEIIESRAYHYFEKKHEGLKPWLWGSDVTRFGLEWNEKEYIDYCEGIANPRRPEFFKGDRILIREITNPRIYAAYTSKEYYNDPSLLIIKANESEEIFDLLGVINSKLATFYHFNNSPKATKGAFPKILIKDIKEFPLPLNFGESFLSGLVNQILSKKEADFDADISKEENEIDLLVYKLYELTWDEVKIVDPEFALSEDEYNAVKVG